jgi:inner membrane protein
MENTTRRWFRDSVTLKIVLIGILTLILLIPSNMIRSLVRERENTRNEVITEVNSLWGDEQHIAGPVISVPYQKIISENKKTKTTIEHVHFLPEELTIKGNVEPETRYRGIYSVVVYNAQLTISGSFGPLNLEGLNLTPDQVLWDQALIYTGISDLRGIQERVELSIDGKNYEVNPGIPVQDVLVKGVSNDLSLTGGQPLQFKMYLELNGSESLNFIPLGKTTRVSLTSSWNTPSFGGAFLPDDRAVHEDGFEAAWSILHLNRNYPQKWLNKKYALEDSSFGVSLLVPVDQYQKTDRAVKYAIMFIGLTFLVFFFTEVLQKVRIHPIQYLLVGLSLVIFYTLLLALSEHLGFSLSYLISSAMILGIIVLYYHHFLRKYRSTAFMGFIMITLYVFLFTTLQLEDYSLLMGSLGLFVVIALIMYISRNVDWYAPIERKAK